MCDLFLFAGEASGDLHGEHLMRALKKEHPGISLAGVGGPRMRAEGLECIIPMEEFQVMGFVDVFLALPKLIRQFYAVRRFILKEKPKAVITIDYPGFNLRMAASLRKHGFSGKLIHYVCPSVWAWGKKRIPFIARHFDLLLCLLPFEPALFAHTPLQAEFIGHPLVSRIEEHEYGKLSLLPVIALFPGSRSKEIERNFRFQLRTARRLISISPHLKCAVSVAHPRLLPLIQKILSEEGGVNDAVFVDAEHSYDLMRQAQLALAKSGTVILELALHKTPTVVTYGVSSLDLFIARKLFRIDLPFYTLPNIILGREVFPELIGTNLTQEKLDTQAERLLLDEKARAACLASCEEVKEALGSGNASENAAKAIYGSVKNFY